MKKGFSIFLVFLFAGIINAPQAQADTNASQFLNTALSTLPAVVKQRTVHTTEQVCRPYKIPRVADGGIGYECHDVDKTHVENYGDQARVTESHVVEVKNFILNTARVASLPDHPILNRQLYKNCADDTTLSTSLTVSVTGTRGYTVTKTQGVSTTTGGSLSITGSYMPAGIGGSSTASFNMSRTVSLSTAEAESDSQAETRSQAWTVTVPPKKIGIIEMLAYQASVEIPFHATVTVDGALESNLSGLTTASQLLSIQQRTLPFEGTLRMTNVSESTFSTSNLPGDANCSASEKGNLISTSDSPKISQSAKFKQQYVTAQAAYEAIQTARKTMFSAAIAVVDGDAGSGATIGPADGVSYSIAYTYPVMRSAPECGFNDLGIPNMAQYNAEVRHYINYASGTIVAQWDDTVYLFDSCYSPLIAADAATSGRFMPADRGAANLLACPMVIDEVCGIDSNGAQKTYHNQCEAIKARATVIRAGSCAEQE